MYSGGGNPGDCPGTLVQTVMRSPEPKFPAWLMLLLLDSIRSGATAADRNIIGTWLVQRSAWGGIQIFRRAADMPIA